MRQKYVKQVDSYNFLYPNHTQAEYDVNIIHDLIEGQVTGTTGTPTLTSNGANIDVSVDYTWNLNGAEPFINNNGVLNLINVYFQTPDKEYFNMWTNVYVLSTAATGTTTTGIENTAIGYNSLRINTTGAQNVAVGGGAMYSANTGSENTAVGYTAMFNNLSGTRNATLGFKSLFGNTSGADNTAIGYQSLINNQSGANNIAVGKDALASNTIRYNSVAVGYQALYNSNRTVDNSPFNIAVGYQAALGLTTGSGNTVLGYQALATATSAGSQVAIGYRAAYNRTINTGETYASTFIGTQAGYAVTSAIELTYLGGFAGRYQTGSYNTAVGTAALYGASGLSTGTNNTALGYVSLFSNTTGANNTAVGHAAGYSNTQGASNVLIGYNAGYSNTKGYGTVAIGIEAAYTTNLTTVGYTGIIAIGTAALKANTTGGPNIAIGGYDAGNIEPALFKNTSGSYNIALGTGALSNNLTASNNTAVGYQAGYTGTAFASGSVTTFGYKAGRLATAGRITAIGDGALSGAATGLGNTAVGYQAGSVTTGASNTYMGDYAGVYVSSGEYNVCIGFLAGYQNNSPALTTGSGNVIIGASSSGIGTATAADTNSVVIGYNISGKGSNTAYIGGSSGAYNQANVTTWATTSDQRIKKNIVDVSNGLSVITALRPVEFDYIESEGGGHQTGFIAQNMESIYPDFVGEREDGMKMIAGWSKTEARLVKAIQEQQAIIESLKARLDAANL